MRLKQCGGGLKRVRGLRQMTSQWSLKDACQTGFLIFIEIKSGSSSWLYTSRSFPRKGENSTSVHSVGEHTAGAYEAATARVLSRAARLQAAVLLEGWPCSQLPSPTLSSNGPVYWLRSRPLHSPTLLKLGWVDFRVKHYLLGPAQLSPALSTLIK